LYPVNTSREFHFFKRRVAMRYNIFILLLLLSHYTGLFSQTGWISVSPPTNSLSSVQMLDTNIIVAVGGHAFVKTTDGGSTWTVLNSVGGGSVFFINEQIGWIVSGGIISKTTNGGSSWSPQGTQFPIGLVSIYFRDTLNGWIVGTGDTVINGSTVPKGVVLHTTDGGGFWSVQWTRGMMQISSIYFVDDTTGWIAGQLWSGGQTAFALKTTNGGNSWNAPGDINVQYSSNSIMHSEYFLNQQSGWVVGDSGMVFHTSDGGTNWNMTILNTFYLYSVIFKSAQQGWIAGSGYIYHTSDGGLNWTPQVHVFVNNYYSLSFYDSLRGFAVGATPDTALVLMTTNGGIPTSVSQNGNEIPTSFKLFQNYPNPFNPSTSISFSLPKESFVSLRVYNILGELITTLVDGQRQPGEYHEVWNSQVRSSGVYICKLQVGSTVQTEMMLLLK
jgi:photosystem II stability/assembly factor-like uncharacterized protein